MERSPISETGNGERIMIYPPGQGKSGQFLMQLWRDYLEQYADKEGDVEGQTVVAAYSAVEVFACSFQDSRSS